MLPESDRRAEFGSQGLQEPSEAPGVPEGRADSQKPILDSLHTCESAEKNDSPDEVEARNPFEGVVRGKAVRLRPMPEGVDGAARQVRKFCLECVGGSPGLVRLCVGFKCPLWHWRFGKSPQFVKDADLLDQEKVRAMAFAGKNR